MKPDMKPCIKPPLGIEPKYIWEDKRFSALRDAIYRYTDDCVEIPVKWIEEYNELIKKRRAEK